jgi:hypothetical protein
MKIEDQIIYQNEDIILMVFITTVHSSDQIDFALDEYFDKLDSEVTLHETYRVNNRLYLWYVVN